jgi:hypothetical protein
MSHMNQTVYQVTRGPIIRTVKSTEGPLGVARALFRPAGRYVPWVQIDDKTTVVNGDIEVKIVDIPLSWVFDCPAPVHN